jgi:hypothetical protein
MKHIGLLIVIVVVLLLSSGSALAYNEIFRVQTQGTEYTADDHFANFGPYAYSKFVFYLCVLNENQILISMNTDFGPGSSIPLTSYTYERSSYYGTTKTAFVASVFISANNYLTLQGIITTNRLGDITAVSGTFIDCGAFELDRFSSGKFWTTKRMPE